jgi:hypothetical protein
LDTGGRTAAPLFAPGLLFFLSRVYILRPLIVIQKTARGQGYSMKVLWLTTSTWTLSTESQGRGSSISPPNCPPSRGPPKTIASPRDFLAVLLSHIKDGSGGELLVMDSETAEFISRSLLLGV